ETLMLITLPESPAVACGTPADTLPREDVTMITKAAASDRDVMEAHLISFRELNLMKSSKLTLALITRGRSAPQEVARRVHAAMLELAPDLDKVAVVGVPADHRLVDPIRCVQRQIVFDYGRN